VKILKIASACLCGIKCRYDGKSCENKKIVELFINGEILPVCPEHLGGLTIPRNPVEIIGGDGKDVLNGKAYLLDKSGNLDCTKQFINGAEKVLRVVKNLGIKEAILKENSPSCGYGKIYDGTFLGRLKEGNGVLAQLLHENGIKIYSSDETW
jgi:uncharacterized protein YbbK (DUF523 family)